DCAHVVASRDVEDAFDDGAVRTGPHGLRGCALAQQQRERADDDGLARARRAVQRVEARLDADGERVDDGEALDAELDEHAGEVSAACGDSSMAGCAHARRSTGSSPQFSLRRSVAKKFWSAKRTSGTVASPLRTTSLSPGLSCSPSWPSTVSIRFSVACTASTVMIVLAGTTSGRRTSVCGQIGVARMHSTLGTTTGPDALSEYAVEPVGVEMTTPSAL